MAGNSKKAGKGGGARKYGRNRKKCETYRLRGVRERNKARRIAKDAQRQS